MTATGWRRTGPRPTRVRLLTALTAVGTLRGLLSITHPASPDAPTAVFASIAALAATLGLMVWLLRWAWCEWLTLVLGLVSVTLVVAVAASGTGAAAASIGYVWLNLYVAFFGSRQVTRAYAAASVALLGLALAINPFPGALAVGVPLAATILLVSEATNHVVTALRRAATTDELTGMLNRNGLFTSAQRSLAQAQRTHRPLTLALVDLDGFKLVNDRQGHPAGDALLASLAKAWQPLLRRSDIVARFGGDEFVLVLPDTSTSDAADLLRRLHGLSPIAWSAGVAAAGPADTLGDLLAAADTDLYRAKTTRSEPPAVRAATAPSPGARSGRPVG